MNVTVNGRTREAAADETVQTLLEGLGLTAQYALEDGDALVVARPVAGG